jgi:5-methylcytosine-specific restriction endonuclease McrA
MIGDDRRVRRRADSLCEYCHSPEKISTKRFTIDHRLPQSLGGGDEFENKRSWIVLKF